MWNNRRANPFGYSRSQFLNLANDPRRHLSAAYHISDSVSAADYAERSRHSIGESLSQRHEDNINTQMWREGRPRFYELDGTSYPLYHDPTEVRSTMLAAASSTGDLLRRRETGTSGLRYGQRRPAVSQIYSDDTALKIRDLDPQTWYKDAKRNFEAQQIKQAMSRAMRMYPVGPMPAESRVSSAVRRTFSQVDGPLDYSGAMSSAEAGYSEPSLEYGAHSGDYASGSLDSSEPAAKIQRG